MARRAQVAAVAIALATASFMYVAAAGQGAAERKVQSTVSLSIDGNVYSGKVTNPEYGCEARRPIKLLTVQPGRDEKLAFTTTDADGRYEVQVLSVKKGTLVKAKAKRVLQPDVECAPAASRPEQKLASRAPVGDATSTVAILSAKDGKVTGRVGSSEPTCVPKRTVKLLAGAGGKGRELDRDQADSAGRWEMKVDDVKPGTVVSAKVTPGFSIGFNCLMAVSSSKRIGGKGK